MILITCSLFVELDVEVEASTKQGLILGRQVARAEGQGSGEDPAGKCLGCGHPDPGPTSPFSGSSPHPNPWYLPLTPVITAALCYESAHCLACLVFLHRRSTWLHKTKSTELR